MRIALVVFLGIVGSDAFADVVACAPAAGTRPQGKFEVWQEPLPAPDYLDGLDACIALSVTEPPPAPPSLWAESQRTAYTNALRKQPVDVLVAPFQIQGYGIERTERAVMSADLAYQLDPTLRVADPFLTARALGEGSRRYDRDDIVELARAVGARTVVVGYVGHDLEHRMTVTIQVLNLEQGGVGEEIQTVQQDWRGVAFTHVDPPFVVFHRMLPSALESLSLPIAKSPSQRAIPVFPDESSFPFADLATNDHPLGASVALSLLGAMASSTDQLSRERLFERALVASWHFDAPSPATAFIRAYALLNLEHRPAALALINGSYTPDSVALRALLNGDLPGASAAVAQVANPLQRLLLGVHVDDLRHTYEKQDVEQATDAESAFGDSAVEWLLLAETRANDKNPWHVDEAAPLKYLLDEIHPVAGLGVQSVLGGGAVVGSATDDVAVDLATLRHVARFVDSADAPVCCSPATVRPNTWDLVSLLEGRTEARMGKFLYLTTIIHGLPERAADAIERYRNAFDGNPLFALSRAEHAMQMSKQSEGDALQRWQREMREQNIVAAAWSAGQNSIAHESARRLGTSSREGMRYLDAYGLDYPRRPYWPFALIRANAGGFYVMRIVDGLRADAFPYARIDAAAFETWGTIQPSDKQRLLGEIATRLIGHPRRPTLVASLSPPPTSSGDPVVDAKVAVDLDPENWDVRFSAGRKLIEEHGRWEEAAELLIAHAPFHSESPGNRVRVSHAAYDAGSIFYWAGHEDLAVPFYETAVNLQTGAESQMTSQIRLDILAGRYRSATAGSYARAQRYPDAFPYRDLLSFMHALGFGENAWDAFPQVASTYADPQVWESAVVGQRIEGRSEAEIRAWLKQPGIRDARFRNRLLAPRYAVLVNASDHMPPEDLGALVEELEGVPTGRVLGTGAQTRPHPENAGETILIPRSVLIPSTQPWSTGASVKSELAFFGAAYAAIRHGRFDVAAAELRRMSEVYPIERPGYSFALPYYAWAAAKAGDGGDLEQSIETIRRVIPPFDGRLITAFFHGIRKESERAREALEAAMRVRPRTENRPVLVEYQWAEACEWLYQETGDDALRDMLLAWVESRQKVEPTHGWAYAMEYTYTKDPQRKRRALAMTLHLDPASPRIRDASANERAEAEAWGAVNNPFLQADDPPEGGATAAVRGAELLRLAGG